MGMSHVPVHVHSEEQQHGDISVSNTGFSVDDCGMGNYPLPPGIGAAYRICTMEENVEDVKAPPFHVEVRRFARATSTADSKYEVSWLTQKMGTKAMVGCATSHMTLWEEIAERDDDEWVLILESDSEWRGFTFPEIPIDGMGADVLLLAGLHAPDGELSIYESAWKNPMGRWCKETGLRAACNRNRPRLQERGWHVAEGCQGTHAYLVNATGARKLIENAVPLSYHVDWRIGWMGKTGRISLLRLDYNLFANGSARTAPGLFPNWGNALWGHSEHGTSLNFIFSTVLVRFMGCNWGCSCYFFPLLGIMGLHHIATLFILFGGGQLSAMPQQLGLLYASTTWPGFVLCECYVMMLITIICCDGTNRRYLV